MGNYGIFPFSYKANGKSPLICVVSGPILLERCDEDINLLKYSPLSLIHIFSDCARATACIQLEGQDHCKCRRPTTNSAVEIGKRRECEQRREENNSA